MGEKYRYEAFISYRRSDGSYIAHVLRRMLQALKLPPALKDVENRQLRIYLDTIYERATEDFFQRNILPSLKQSQHLIIICTPHVFNPRSDGKENWMVQEIQEFRKLPQGDNVIAVMGRGEFNGPLPAKLHDLLPNIQRVDLRALRRLRHIWWPWSSRVDDELLKIAATLYDVKPSEMPVFRQEEARRRVRRARGVAIVAIILLAIVSGFAAWAVFSLHQSAQRLVSNHTLQGRHLFEQRPVEAHLHFARAIALADSFFSARLGFPLDASTARTWYASTSSSTPPLVVWQDAAITTAEFSSDGNRFVIGNRSNSATIFNAQTGLQKGKNIIHNGSIEHANFSPDGRFLVTSGRDNYARLANGDTGESTGVNVSHSDYVMCAVFAPTSDRFITCGADGSSRIWEAETGKPLGAPMVHESSIHWAGFSPDGSVVATAGADRRLKIWEAQTGREVGTPIEIGDVWTAEFSPDGRYLIVPGQKILIDVTSGKRLGAPFDHPGTVLDAKFSPDGQYIATAGRDGDVRIWKIEDRTLITNPLVHPDRVLSVEFSPNGRYLLTTCSDEMVRIWEVRTRSLLATLAHHLGGVVAASFHPDGSRVLSAGEDGTARIHTLEQYSEELLQLAESERTLDFDINAEILVTATDDNIVQIRKAPDWHVIQQLPKHNDLLMAARINAPSQVLATTTRQWEMNKGWIATTHLWDKTTDNRIATIGPSAGLISPKFSPDGTLIIMGERSKMVDIYDTSTGVRKGVPLQRNDTVWAVSFSPDATLMATAENSGIARILNVSTGKDHRPPIHHDAQVIDLQFSPDGEMIATATGSYQNQAQLWSVHGGGPIKTPFQHASGINSIRFDADGDRVVTASWDHTAQVWDVTTGGRVGKPLKHGDIVKSAKFDASGGHIITGSSDRTAQVWETLTGEPVGSALVHEKEVVDARFSNNGRWIVTKTNDDVLHLWRYPTTDLPGSVLLLLAEVITLQTLDASTGALRSLLRTEWEEKFEQIELP